MSFEITNLFDGTVQTVPDNGTAEIILPRGGQHWVIARSTTSVETGLTWFWHFGSDLAVNGSAVEVYENASNIVGPFGAPTAFDPTAIISFLLTALDTLPGIYSFDLISSVTWAEPAPLAVHLRVIVVEKALAAPPLDWVLPAPLIDLQFDLGSRRCPSRVLSTRLGGLKEGDLLQFAFVPTLDGALVAAGITALSIAFKNASEPNGDTLIFEEDSPTFTVVGGDGYWLLSFEFTDAAETLRGWFSLANAGDTVVEKLDVLMEARLTLSATAITSESFIVPAAQAIKLPA